ncbi:hypothetical protein H4582DRAFT_2017394 [Lactarius indigo]|nr:hypothetical protein H4582DRAFT_2017394 [Lactarius indigo]
MRHVPHEEARPDDATGSHGKEVAVYAPPPNEVVHEDEDGWVSDQSLPEDAQTKVQPHAEKRYLLVILQRLPVPNTAAMVTAPSAPSTSAGPESPLPKSPSSPSDMVDDEPRGRALPASASSTFSVRRKPRNMRIVSLRGSEASSREVSAGSFDPVGRRRCRFHSRDGALAAVPIGPGQSRPVPISRRQCRKRHGLARFRYCT